MASVTICGDVLVLGLAVFDFWIVTPEPGRAALFVDRIKIRKNYTGAIAIATDAELLSGLVIGYTFNAGPSDEIGGDAKAGEGFDVGSGELGGRIHDSSRIPALGSL